MSGKCNHTSVGIIVEHDGKFLLFDRVKFPLFKAAPAGHVDEFKGVPIPGSPTRQQGDAYCAAGVRELREETGISVSPRDLELASVVKVPNECRRATVDGDAPWHLWYVFAVQLKRMPAVKAAAGESRNLTWYTPQEIRALRDLEPVWRTHLAQAGVI